VQLCRNLRHNPVIAYKNRILADKGRFFIYLKLRHNPVIMGKNRTATWHNGRKILSSIGQGPGFSVHYQAPGQGKSTRPSL
ncbi:MAG: hypothetical protein M3347_05960, partial [Armatimonadota bacterium]|nr:hypothetical protein [Armatimonadota bacterium]